MTKPDFHRISALETEYVKGCIVSYRSTLVFMTVDKEKKQGYKDCNKAEAGEMQAWIDAIDTLPFYSIHRGLTNSGIRSNNGIL